MKTCRDCGIEICTRDRDNRCARCENIADINEGPNPQIKHERRQARWNRAEREHVLRDLGLVKVRGALGGTYWE